MSFAREVAEHTDRLGPSKNTHTLVPMCLETTLLYMPGAKVPAAAMDAPVPLVHVHPRFRWTNSDGYTFDARNLAVLCRTGYRNVNPHTMDSDGDHRPIWINKRDVMTLLQHPHFDAPKRNGLYARVNILRCLDPAAIEALCTAAHELVSIDYTGFARWLAEHADALPWEYLYDGDPTRRVPTIVRALAEIQERRRHDAIAAIRGHSSAQAAEHLVEPYGVNSGDPVYSLLEMYKVGVVKDFLAYAQHRETQSNRLRWKLTEEYTQLLNDRFATIAAKIPDGEPFLHLSLIDVTNMRNKIRVMHHNFRRKRVRRSVVVPNSTSFPTVVFQVAKIGDEFMVTGRAIPVDETDTSRIALAADSYETVVTSMLNIVQMLLPRVGQCVVHLCKISPHLGLDRRFATASEEFVRSTITADLFMSPNPVTFINERITQAMVLDTESSATNAMWSEMVKIGIRDKMMHQFLKKMVRRRRDLYAGRALREVTVVGGYDNTDYGEMRRPTPIARKLGQSLMGHTCVQDVASELVEFLSVPCYPAGYMTEPGPVAVRQVAVIPPLFEAPVLISAPPSESDGADGGG